jgi:hypothetical protein
MVYVSDFVDLACLVRWRKFASCKRASRFLRIRKIVTIAMTATRSCAGNHKIDAMNGKESHGYDKNIAIEINGRL